MRKKSGIVRYSAKQIGAKIARGEDRTDWVKAGTVQGRKLEASIRADVDESGGDADWTRAVRGIPAPKDHINLRVDHEVLGWFRARGKGYQTLMNNVLTEFVRSRQGR